MAEEVGLELRQFGSAYGEQVPGFAVAFVAIARLLAGGRMGQSMAMMRLRLPSSKTAGIRYHTSSGMT